MHESESTPALPERHPVEASDEVWRAKVWGSYGASASEAAELLAYSRSPFPLDGFSPVQYPLPDESFVVDWERYLVDARQVGVFGSLRRRLVQLSFPVAEGTSRTDLYLAITRFGIPPPENLEGLRLVDPDGLRLLIHRTPAGRIPVIVAEAREDFVLLVQALTRHNEPAGVPDSMGALTVAGYNNWDRVAKLRLAWEAEHPEEHSDAWPPALKQMRPRRELYQDRFILLSSGPYSAVSAEAVGVDERTWIAQSLRIRLQHECVHYFTRRVFGAMRNSLMDELVADYVGVVSAAGRFRADWFLRFMGLESFPVYRRGGRLENYRGEPPLSDGAFAVLQAVVMQAAVHLERFEGVCMPRGEGLVEIAIGIRALSRVGLEGLASEAAEALLERTFRLETHRVRRS